MMNASNPYAAPKSAPVVSDHIPWSEQLKGALGPWAIFKFALRVVARQPFEFLLVILMTSLPINTVLELNDSSTLETVQDWSHWFRLSQSLEMFVGILSTIGVVQMTSVIVHQGTAKRSEVWRHMGRRWGAAIWTRILHGIGVAVMLVLLIVPGIILSVFWAFVDQVIVLRDKSGTEALSETKAIVDGNWWKVFGHMLAYFLFLLPFFTMLAIGQALFEEYVVTHAVVSVISGAIGDVIFCLGLVCMTLLFLNLENLHEQRWDVLDEP